MENSKINEVVLVENDPIPRGSFALIVRGGGEREYEILLVKRRDYNIWNLPGGALEKEEMFKAAAERETLEETGLKVKAILTLGVVYSPALDKEVPIGAENREDWYGLVVCSILSGEFRPSSESSDFGWFSVENLPPDLYERHKVGILRLFNSQDDTEIIDDSIRDHQIDPYRLRFYNN
jgi:8-oxo-dGTP diphosphatase